MCKALLVRFCAGVVMAAGVLAHAQTEPAATTAGGAQFFTEVEGISEYR